MKIRRDKLSSSSKKIAHEDHKLVIIVTHETEVAQNSDVVYQLKNKKFTKLETF